MEKKFKKNPRLERQKVETLQELKKSNTKQNLDFNLLDNHNTEKYFESIEKTFPKYSQALTELHKEFILYFQNILKTSIFFQKEFFWNTQEKPGEFKTPFIMTANSSETIIELNQIRDQFVLSALESIKNIIKDWNQETISYSNALKVFLTRK